MNSKPSTSQSHRNDQGVYEEVSFGDFTNIYGLPRHELFEGDFSVLDGYSSVLNGDGLASPSYIYEQDSRQVAEVQQKLVDAQDTIRQLRHRLVRRTSVIEGIRKYYLRDVVTMKHILRELLSETERKEAWRQYEHILPSIDLKVTLLNIKICWEEFYGYWQKKTYFIILSLSLFYIYLHYRNLFSSTHPKGALFKCLPVIVAVADWNSSCATTRRSRS
ncbi:hypothetical protein EON65_23270 [archaeon]|nr:MAG: hypothetical protein EON65_23270 [archaeon]